MWEVILALVFVFLVASLVCTAIKEGVEAVLRKRGGFLKQGLGELLNGPGGTASASHDWVQKFYSYPLISSLYLGKFDEKSRDLPSYIPSDAFSSTLLQLVGQEAARRRAESAATAEGASLQAVQLAGERAVEHIQFDPVNARTQVLQALRELPNEHLRQSLQAVVGVSGESLEEVKASLEHWFNNSMDRVTGYYKRHTQHLIFLIAVVVTLSLNLNSLTLTQKLINDSTLRQALVAQAEAYVQDSRTAGPRTPADPAVQIQDSVNRVAELQLPIGWDRFQSPVGFWAWVSLLAGYLTMIFAISLGAPFWFDLLNKIIQLRGALDPQAARKRAAAVAEAVAVPRVR